MLIQSPKPAHWVAGIAFSRLLVACSSQTSTESVEDAPPKPEVRIKLNQPVATPVVPPIYSAKKAGGRIRSSEHGRNTTH